MRKKGCCDMGAFKRFLSIFLSLYNTKLYSRLYAWLGGGVTGHEKRYLAFLIMVVEYIFRYLCSKQDLAVAATIMLLPVH